MVVRWPGSASGAPVTGAADVPWQPFSIEQNQTSTRWFSESAEQNAQVAAQARTLAALAVVQSAS